MPSKRSVPALEPEDGSKEGTPGYLKVVLVEDGIVGFTRTHLSPNSG